MFETGDKSKPRILLVDDEAEVLNSLADLLRKDFQVFATSDVNEALELLRNCNNISTVIADQRMPVMNGSEFLAEAARINPETFRILLTGFSDISAVVNAINQGQIILYISKPWDASALLNLLKPIAQKHQLQQEQRELISQLGEIGDICANLPSRLEKLESRNKNLVDDNLKLRLALQQYQNLTIDFHELTNMLPVCMDCGQQKSVGSSWEEVITFLKDHFQQFGSNAYCSECRSKITSQWGKNRLGEQT